jgi:hypothetical protein
MVHASKQIQMMEYVSVRDCSMNRVNSSVVLICIQAWSMRQCTIVHIVEKHCFHYNSDFSLDSQSKCRKPAQEVIKPLCMAHSISKLSTYAVMLAYQRET